MSSVVSSCPCPWLPGGRRSCAGTGRSACKRLLSSVRVCIRARSVASSDIGTGDGAAGALGAPAVPDESPLLPSCRFGRGADAEVAVVPEAVGATTALAVATGGNGGGSINAGVGAEAGTGAGAVADASEGEELLIVVVVTEIHVLQWKRPCHRNRNRLRGAR